MAARLSLQNVQLHFGGVTVLNNVSFHVEPGQVFGLVGPNGAGKTSLFNCISGHYRPNSGSITIDGAEVSRAGPAHRAGYGLARTFQHPALQLGETVLENVLLGAHSRLPGGPLAWAARLPYVIRAERELRDEAMSLLEAHGLGWAAQRRASELSHGLHKGIELCRALMLRPKLLLLDEPAAGLPHSEVEHFIRIVRALREDSDVTIVIVEHNMGLIAVLTDSVVVLEHGAMLFAGTAESAQSDPRVVEAYLGREDSDAAT